MRAALLLAFAACVPATDEIGTTEWSVTIDYPEIARSGRGGQVALAAGVELEILGSDGASAWRATLPGDVVDVALDDAGGAIVLHRLARGFTPANALTRFTAAGAVQWQVTRADDPSVASTLVVRDVEDATWLVTSSPIAASRWERYDMGGTQVGGGTLAFARSGIDGKRGATALPGGGIAFPDDERGISAIDTTGARIWRVSPVHLGAYAVHDDGELTVDRGEQIERLDANRVVRWSLPLHPLVFTMAPLDDGSVVFGTSDGLDDGNNVPVLMRVDRDGAWQREVIRTGFTSLDVVPAPPRPDVRILAGHETGGGFELVSRAR